MFSAFLRVIPLLTLLNVSSFFLWGCQAEDGSLSQATHHDKERGKADRTRIYNSVYETSTNVFRILKDASARTETNRLIRERAENMIRNMTLVSNASVPMHPAIFFSVVKDFETSTDLRWGGIQPDGRYRDVMTTRNCTSGECYGLFQVDVKLETTRHYPGHPYPWDFNQICSVSGGGLGLSATQGGNDYCAALYWWTVAEGGGKCARMNPGGRNPCNDVNVPWTEKMMNRGPAVYVQAHQPKWGANGWYTMYQYYKDIALEIERATLRAEQGETVAKNADRLTLLRSSIDRWLETAGYGEFKTGEGSFPGSSDGQKSAATPEEPSQEEQLVANPDECEIGPIPSVYEEWGIADRVEQRMREENCGNNQTE